MKKQILTLTMCIALTATMAIAQEPAKDLQKAATQAKITAGESATKIQPEPSKKGEQPKMTREEAKKQFEARRAQKRQLMYNALDFSAEQKTKAEALDAKTKTEAIALLKKVQSEAIKLRELKTKKASIFAIWKQERALKTSKKELQNYLMKSKNEFDAILTKEQKLKLDEMKKFKKSHEQKRRGKGPKGPKGSEPMGPPPVKK